MINPIPSPDDQPKPDMDLNEALAELLHPAQPKMRIVPRAASPSRSQLVAVQQLENLFKLKLLGASAGGVQVRTHALICGGSGSGKTTTTQIFATRTNLPIYATTVGSWIPSGAKREPNTLDQIGKFVRSHPAGIIFVDEIDKLTTRLASEQFWSSSLTIEILSLLDSDARLESTAFSESDRHRLQHSFLLVAAGAWQSIWSDVGNIEEPLRTQTYAQRIAQDSGLPEELFFRFARPLVTIGAPDVNELGEFILRIHQQAKSSPPQPQEIKELVEHATKSGRAMRFLEDYATNLMTDVAGKHSLPKLLGSLEPVKPAQSSAHFGETNQEAQKRLYASLRSQGAALEQTGHELGQLFQELAESHWMRLHRELAYDTSEPTGKNPFGFSERDLDELPTIDHIEGQEFATPDQRRKGMTELQTAFCSVGESSVAYLCLGETFLNKRHESRVCLYGGWLTALLIDVLNGPPQLNFPRKLRTLLWRYVREHRDWMQSYSQLVATLV